MVYKAGDTLEGLGYGKGGAYPPVALYALLTLRGKRICFLITSYTPLPLVRKPLV